MAKRQSKPKQSQVKANKNPESPLTTQTSLDMSHDGRLANINTADGPKNVDQLSTARNRLSLTDWITAISTMVIMIWAGLQWNEMRTGGADTHNLAVAAVAANRAWLAPEQIILTSSLESGLPVKYQIRIVNPGKEPAIGVVWRINPIGVAYIPDQGGSTDVRVESNNTCVGLEPNATHGIVVYPAGPTNFWLPSDVSDTAEHRRLLGEILDRKKSLVIEGFLLI